jgi:hypothetical protein
MQGASSSKRRESRTVVRVVTADRGEPRNAGCASRMGAAAHLVDCMATGVSTAVMIM